MNHYEPLKHRQRLERDHYPQNLSIRIHRSLSWLQRAEMCDDNDGKFIFLWIAFNAAYAQEYEHKAGVFERQLYQQFIEKLIECDSQQRLFSIVWEEYSSAIRVILDNEFILHAYWEFQAGRMNEQEWKAQRASAKVAANKALSQQDTATVLAIVFARLYTLRNQLIHGGATCNSSANRQQLKDCTGLLNKIIPTIIEIMMDSADTLWGDPVYPLV